MTPPTDPLAIARAALEPGEHLVWADRPHPQALARARLPQVIRGVLGLAVIAVFLWLSFVPNWPGGLRGLLFALFLAAVTLYSLWLLLQPQVARRAAGQTVYAITDRRLIALEGWPRARLRSFQPAELDAPQVAADVVDGAQPPRGTVIFIHRKLPWWQRSAGGSYQLEAFFGIPEAESVAERIEALRSGQPPAPPAGDS